MPAKLSPCPTECVPIASWVVFHFLLERMGILPDKGLNTASALIFVWLVAREPVLPGLGKAWSV